MVLITIIFRIIILIVVVVVRIFVNNQNNVCYVFGSCFEVVKFNLHPILNDVEEESPKIKSGVTSASSNATIYICAEFSQCWHLDFEIGPSSQKDLRRSTFLYSQHIMFPYVFAIWLILETLFNRIFSKLEFGD